MDLSSLLLCLDGLTDSQIEAVAREWYAKLYITTSRGFGVLKSHDGDEVIFWRDRFEHAFFTTSDRIGHPDRKDVVARERIERIRWIRGVVAGNVAESACWEVPSPTGRRRPPNRLYIVSSEIYVVWLEPRISGGWKFSSAYTATAQNVRRYCQGGKKIWQHK
jgi:hypothetical protein